MPSHWLATCFHLTVALTWYPLVAELAYKAPDREGHGRTLKLSNTRVLFEADQPLAIGIPIELAIAWPAVLNDHSGLCLFISGSIAACQSRQITVAISRYDFRARSLARNAISTITSS